MARSVWLWKTVNVERSGFSWSFGLEIFYSWGSVGTVGTDGTEGNRGQVPVFLWLAGSEKAMCNQSTVQQQPVLLVRVNGVAVWRFYKF